MQLTGKHLQKPEQLTVGFRGPALLALRRRLWIERDLGV
jgi:hypothetical protein